MMHRVVRTGFCSTLAMATAMLAAPHRADAQVVGTVDSHINANVSTIGTTTQVDVTAPQATIDWTATGVANGGTINFLPQDSTLAFQGTSNFAVLNRIAPGVAGNSILIDGHVLSSVAGNAGRGTVFFSTPNGLIIGSHAVIDVGGLGLTTSPIAADGNGNWLTQNGSEQTIAFGQASNAAGFIRVDNGASISTRGSGAFMALVAPRVEVYSKLKTDGTIGVVAAEAATLTIRDSGLWDIVVDSGTTDANGVVMAEDGGTARVDETPLGTYNRRAYIVAVSKNDALTMVFGQGASLGFDVAGSASVEDNVVVLSAGSNILEGVAQLDTAKTVGHQDITLDGVTATSRLIGSADGELGISSHAAASRFDADVDLSATGAVHVNAVDHDTTLAGNLTVTTDRTGTAGSVYLYAANGNTLSLGNVHVNANGAGASTYASGGTGGTGTGGDVYLTTDSGGHITSGDVTLIANGYGGASGGEGGIGGAGHGGRIGIGVSGAGSSLALGAITASAQGQGGGLLDCEVCFTRGGAATGGTIDLYADRGTVHVAGNVDLDARASGGSGDAGGGDATGTSVAVSIGNAGAITIDGPALLLNASADGGSGYGDSAAGGNATGGHALLNNYLGGSGTLTMANEIGEIDLEADGTGGYAFGNAAGGLGHGGTAAMDMPGITIEVPGLVTVSASGSGGGSWTGAGGRGEGGNATIILHGLNPGTLSHDISAWGDGGSGTYGGIGQGGFAGLFLDAGNNSVAGGTINARGTGGYGFGTGGSGGEGKGGTAQIESRNGGNLALTGDLTLDASGWGGTLDASDSHGGAATGGHALALGSSGATLAFANLTLDASAHGADGAGTGHGGAALGGDAGLDLRGASGTVGGDLGLYASGFAGGSYDGAGGSGTGGNSYITLGNASDHLQISGLTNLFADGNGGSGVGGGDGVGGWSRIYGTAGNATFTGAVDIRAEGNGGSGGPGAGGNAVGGRARLNADGAHYQLSSVSLDTSAYGGSGATGGDASDYAGGGGQSGLFATNGGSVTLSGTAYLDASSHGGNGFDGGAGGSALAGESVIYAAGGGSIALQRVDAYAEATGGSGGDGGLGGNGGDGGDAIGGFVQLRADGSATGQAQLTTGDVTLYATGTGGGGGAGGQAPAGGVGGNGGAGGLGKGGSIQVAATSSNGQLDVGRLWAFAGGHGGDGGAGGFGGAERGGNGGAGGDARGGSTSIGTLSGDTAIAGNSGKAKIASILAHNDSIGGDGGDGGVGDLGTGNGGDGGFGLASFLVIVARGGTLEVGDVNVPADSVGGRGGSGAVAGVAGNADSSDIIFDFSNRATGVADRAAVTLGTVYARSRTSSTGGLERALGGVALLASNADVHMTSFEGQTIGADGPHPTSGPDGIKILNGQVTVDGDFALATDNLAWLWVQNGGLTAQNFALTARDFVHLPSSVTPAPMGGVSAGTISLNSQNDIVADANLTSGSDLMLDAPGKIEVGALRAAGNVGATAGGTIIAGAISAGDSVRVRANGNVTLGHVDAGITDPALPESSTYEIALLSRTGNVTTGNLNALGEVMAAAHGALRVGSVTGYDFFGLAGDTIDTGAITADGGPLLLGHYDMMAAGGEIGGTFNSNDVLYGDRLSTGGAVTIGGNASASTIIAYAGRNLTSGALTTSDDDIDLNSGGNIHTGALNSGFNAFASATGSVQVDGAIDSHWVTGLSAGSTLTTGNIRAGRWADLYAGGAIQTGDISAGLTVGGGPAIGPLATGGDDISIDGGGNVDVGNLTAANGNVSALANGHLKTGAISSGGFVVGLAQTDIDTGTIDAADDVVLAHVSSAGSERDPHAALAGSPAPTGGHIVTGRVAAGGSVTAAALGAITMGAVGAGGDIGLDAGGNVGVGALRAGGDIDVSSGGAISGLTASAGDSLVMSSNGGITLTNLDAGIVSPSAFGAYGIGLVSNGPIHIGNAQAAGDIGLASAGAITAGNLAAGTDLLVLGGGTVTLGSLSAANRIGIGGFALFGQAGGIDAFDKEIAFGGLDLLDGPMTGGAVSVTGPVTANRVTMLAGGDLTVGALTARQVDARAAATAHVNGAWSVGNYATLASNDIDIGSNGSINANWNQLISTNANGAWIGGGLTPTGNGYVLDGAEFARLTGQSMVSVDSLTSAPATVTLGNLALQGGGERLYAFGNYDPANNRPAGTMRVLGNIVGTGFTSSDMVALSSAAIEIDAVNARIALTGQGSAPAGQLTFYGNQVRAASQAVLAKLAANPDYSGRDADLATSVNRPDGYLVAGDITVYLTDPAATGQVGLAAPLATSSAGLYLQNSGSGTAADARAGFFANAIDVVIDESLAAGSVTMVVNGQLTGEGGNRTGATVRDAFTTERDLAPYAPASTINGCSIGGGACAIVAPPPYNPGPALQSEIVLFGDLPTGGPDFGNEEAIEDNQEGGGEDGASSAITPPIPLFDSTALALEEDSDDPVGGGGNAALMQQCTGEGEQNCEGGK